MHYSKDSLLLFSVVAFSMLVSCRTTTGISSAHAKKQKGHGDQPAWSYTGNLSPEHWSDLCSEFRKCAEGQHQSPIDIETVFIREISDSGLKLRYHPSQVDVQNNGHTIEVDLEEPDTLDTGNGVFVLKQFHFHEPAEHKIDGVLYPMEMHLVHVNQHGQLAVLGVFIKEGAPNAAL
ncbi:MAG: carbonic anhydrase family protein, partial [Bacteroidetes bacterium]